MTDLSIADAPEIPKEQLQDGTKIPTGGFGNYAVSVQTIRDWLVTYKDIATTTSVNNLQVYTSSHISNVSNPHQVTKAQVGLGNVDNTSDLNKPISTATQAALDFKADSTATQTKFDYIHQNGAALPYDATMEYAENALVIKDGVLQQWKGGAWVRTDAASQIFDASGKTQQEVNDSNVKFYNTTSVMLADTSLKDGDIVATKGYHSISDDGGATYLISATSTTYSIPLANGLHAVFRDDFDIRKFGIKDDIALDQTEYLDRMVAYADTRIYEIDFLNFEIMSPKTLRWFNGASNVRGLMFNKPHRLKNLKIANDKTVQLQQGTNCIVFAPDDLNGTGVFELDNVVFDPYVSNYLVTAPNFDGYMCGFVADWHPTAGAVHPTTDATKSNYILKLNNITFESPAVSYNMTCSSVFFDTVHANNIKGEYLASFLVVHAQTYKASNFHGVFRDDYYATAGRLLVTNLMHHEAEVTGFPLSLGDFDINDVSCVKYTDNTQHCVFKVHKLGTNLTFNSINVSSIIGSVEFYAGSINDEVTKRKFQINKLSVSDIRGITVLKAPVYVKELLLESPEFKTDFNLTLGLLDYLIADSVSIIGKISLVRYLAFADTYISNLYMDNVIVEDQTYGLIRSDSVYVDNIVIDKAHVKSDFFILAHFKDIKVRCLDVEASYHANFFYSLYTSGAFTPSIEIQDYHQRLYLEGDFINCAVGLTGAVKFIGCGLKQSNNLNNCIVTYVDSRVESSKVQDWPSLAAGVVQSTTVTLLGANIGDAVFASMTVSLSGTRLWAEVTTANTVTVYHQNPTGSAVDLASGTLTVKLI